MMKKLLLSLLFLIIVIIASAQGTILHLNTAGTLDSFLAKKQKDTITNLTLTGNIDARDIKFLRDSMPVLAVLDLSNVQIKAYTGTKGTVSSNLRYGENKFPSQSFSADSSGYLIGKNLRLKSIKFPNNITSIDDDAFYDCFNLKGNLVIPNTVTRINYGAFNSCTGFSGNLFIPNSVESIGSYAFTGCTGFTGLSLPQSLKEISNCAFLDCTGFTGNLIIPDSVLEIGYSAFEGCSGFSDSIKISKSVRKIEKSAFNYCNKIKTIYVDPNNTNYTSISGVLFDKNVTQLIQFPGGKIIDSYTIPGSVNSILNNAFNGCSGIKILNVLNFQNSKV